MVDLSPSDSSSPQMTGHAYHDVYMSSLRTETWMPGVRQLTIHSVKYAPII